MPAASSIARAIFSVFPQVESWTTRAFIYPTCLSSPLPVQSNDIRVFRIIPRHLVNVHAPEACYETAPMLVLDVVGTRDLSPQGLPKMIL
jgi:hypothetical protein